MCIELASIQQNVVTTLHQITPLIASSAQQQGLGFVVQPPNDVCKIHPQDVHHAHTMLLHGDAPVPVSYILGDVDPPTDVEIGLLRRLTERMHGAFDTVHGAVNKGRYEAVVESWRRFRWQTPEIETAMAAYAAAAHPYNVLNTAALLSPDYRLMVYGSTAFTALTSARSHKMLEGARVWRLLAGWWPLGDTGPLYTLPTMAGILPPPFLPQGKVQL